MAMPVVRGHLTVGIARDGGVWLPGARDPGPIADARLAARLREDYTARGDRSAVLHLVADRSAPHARVQTVLRAAQDVGVHHIALIAECPRGKQSLLRDCRP